jgi:hypothetical protein
MLGSEQDADQSPSRQEVGSPLDLWVNRVGARLHDETGSAGRDSWPAELKPGSRRAKLEATRAPALPGDHPTPLDAARTAALPGLLAANRTGPSPPATTSLWWISYSISTSNSGHTSLRTIRESTVPPSLTAAIAPLSERLVTRCVRISRSSAAIATGFGARALALGLGAVVASWRFCRVRVRRPPCRGLRRVRALSRDRRADR